MESIRIYAFYTQLKKMYWKIQTFARNTNLYWHSFVLIVDFYLYCLCSMFSVSSMANGDELSTMHIM